jgi:hypothetical protein
VNYRELRTVLLSKGEAVEDRASHHIFYFIEVDGKIYRATKFSHNARGRISNEILGAIARQMRLKTKELRRFVNCSVDRAEWLQIWRQRAPS